MSEFYLQKPDDFHVELEVSTVFIECKKKVLLLQRAAHKIAPNSWAVPGGKLEGKETPKEGLIREIQEELQLIAPQDKLKLVDSRYVRHPLMQYRLHLFHWQVPDLPKIILNPEEHQAFCWQSISDFHALPLMEGQLEAFLVVYGSHPDRL